MARFILDVGNLEPDQIQELYKQVLKVDMVADTISTIYCIDETNENQFYADGDFEKGHTNELSEKQINHFKTICNFQE